MILILQLVALSLKFSNRIKFLSIQIVHKTLIKPASHRSFSREESRLNFINLQSSGLKVPPWFQSHPEVGLSCRKTIPSFSPQFCQHPQTQFQAS
ncbi:hypothetical protein NC651_024230 [Populus alba x Populus x berolinensis]|nr:hypothetical protein NC651_024230 [Populus alba x Populus x berolinensis]